MNLLPLSANAICTPHPFFSPLLPWLDLLLPPAFSPAALHLLTLGSAARPGLLDCHTQSLISMKLTIPELTPLLRLICFQCIHYSWPLQPLISKIQSWNTAHYFNELFWFFCNMISMKAALGITQPNPNNFKTTEMHISKQKLWLLFFF